MRRDPRATVLAFEGQARRYFRFMPSAEHALFTATYDALVDVYKQPAPLERMVRLRLGEALAQVAPFGAGTALLDTIFGLVDWAERGGRIKDLVAAIRADSGMRPKVSAAYKLAFPEETAAGPVSACPYDAVMVGASPFVDREPLRLAMRAVALTPPDGPVGPRLLAITGPPDSGKTYSSLLVQAGRARYGYETALVDVAELAVEGGGPEAVVHAVLSTMGGLDLAGLALPGEPATARTTVTLVNRAVGLLRNSSHAGRKWWIVFDSLDQDCIPPATLGAVVKLASSLVTDLGNFRVSLLGYRRPVVAPASAYVRRAPLEPLTRPQLEPYLPQLRQYVASMLQEYQPGVADDVVQAVFDTVLASIPVERPDALRVLKDLADAAVAKLFEQEGGV